MLWHGLAVSNALVSIDVVALCRARLVGYLDGWPSLGR